jgi:hypothetical protein
VGGRELRERSRCGWRQRTGLRGCGVLSLRGRRRRWSESLRLRSTVGKR